MIKFFRESLGHSLIELVVALGIFAILVSALLVFSGNGLTVLERSSYYMRALSYLEEQENALRSIKQNSWNSLNLSQSVVSTSSGKWSLEAEGASTTIDSYSIKIIFDDVYRNNAGNIVSSDYPEAIRDVFSKYANIEVAWSVPDQRPIELDKKILITHYDAKVWEQSDWSQSDGQSIWVGDGYYLSSTVDDSSFGEIKLPQTSSSSYALNASLESSAYDSGKGSSFTVVTWDEEISDTCVDCRVELRIKTAPDLSGNPGTWSSSWSGPDGEDGDELDFFASSTGEIIHVDHNLDQWIKYQASLGGDGSSSPIVKNIKIFYQ